jgi:pimeloyl-ACP methyl ester carboxylesterase
MSLWLDLLGAEICFVETPSFGRTRIAEAGAKDAPPLLFLHGIGGHLEAYAKNVVALSDEFRVIAYDYVGHGLSERKVMDYTPLVLCDHLRELLDVLEIERAHLSGESLGGWVSGIFATQLPERVGRLMLNTAAGIPIVTEKGRRELEELKALSQKAQAPTEETVRNRMKWLFHPANHAMISDELVATRLRMYRQPGSADVGPRILAMIPKHDDFLIPLEKIRAETLFLWTEDNPVHDLETARASVKRVRSAELYVMEAKSAHWPQYEAPDEFNAVARRFFATGKA